MFVHKTGDIFTTTMPAIAHGVNTRGMMGAGIAKIIATKFPAVLAPYREACKNKELVPGGFQAVKVQEDPELFIFNLASQEKPGRDATLERIHSALEKAIAFARGANMPGFAICRIGSKIGGLDWHTEVKPLVEKLAEAEDGLMIELWSLPDAD